MYVRFGGRGHSARDTLLTSFLHNKKNKRRKDSGVNHAVDVALKIAFRFKVRARKSRRRSSSQLKSSSLLQYITFCLLFDVYVETIEV